MQRISKVITRILLTFLFFGWVALVMAAGILVKPAELKFTLTVGQSASRFLTVENISGRPVLYHAYADELEDQIIIEPTDFRLEVKERQRLKITIQPKLAGLGATNLSIVAQDLDRREFNVATGVKVPIIFEAVARPKTPFSFFSLPLASKWSIAIFLGLIVGLLFTWLILRKRKKKWWSLFGQSVNLLKHHQRPWWKKIFD